MLLRTRKHVPRRRIPGIRHGRRILSDGVVFAFRVLPSWAAGAGLGSGAGSVSGSRSSAGWSSTPERWQTMQQRTEPGSIGRWWPQEDRGVYDPIGKKGINRGGRTAVLLSPGLS